MISNAPRMPSGPISSPPRMVARIVDQTGSVPRSKLVRDALVCFTAQFIPMNANDVQIRARKSMIDQSVKSYFAAVAIVSVGFSKSMTAPEVETVMAVRFTGEI